MIVERQHLLSTLTQAKQARGRRHTVSVLQAVMIDVNGLDACIKATDMDVFAEFGLAPDESPSRFQALLDVDKCIELLKAMNHVQRVWIDQTAEGHMMVVNAAASEARPAPIYPTTAGAAAIANAPSPMVSTMAESPMSGFASFSLKPGK